ncbi:MAG: hypothetical protein ABI947_25495 [Chloroflexota bacterium]
MYRARRYLDNFNGSDRVTQIIAIVALVLLLIIAVPYLPTPWVANGVGCIDMSSPKLSGSNQSLLARSDGASNGLILEISPDRIQIAQGQPLTFDVRFINDSMAPLTLFFVEDQYILGFTDTEDGLIFSIQSANGRALGEPPNSRARIVAPQQYAASQLRVLRPRQRCSVNITVSPNRLAAAQMGDGQYRITVVYRNRSKGVLPAVQNLTPTPIFPDQGVWTGQVQSNDMLLAVGTTPAQ